MPTPSPSNSSRDTPGSSTSSTQYVAYLPVPANVLEANLTQCWIFAELVFVYFMYVETKGPTLEELAKIIDGNDAKVAHLDMEQLEKERQLGRDEHVELPPTRL